MKSWTGVFLILLLLAAPCAFGQQARPEKDSTAAKLAATTAENSLYSQPDTAKRAAAYYYFSIGHIYEQEYGITGRSEYANQAIDSYKKALELDPGAPAIIERLAETYAESQRIRDAVLQAEEALRQDPNNLAAHRLLARIYVRTLGDLNSSTPQKDILGRAVEQFQAILRIDPADTPSALWLARLYGFENQHQKAEEVLRNVLKRDPQNEPTLQQLSQLLLDQGRASEAVTLLSQASARSSSPELYNLLGDAYSQIHAYAKAEAAYRKAVEKDPDEASHRRGLAETLMTEGKYEEALEQYERLTELEPDSAQNYLRMAQLYRHLNQLDQAEASLLRAKQLAPGNLEILYNEALLYEAQGRFGDAVKVLSDGIAGLKAQAGESNAKALAILYEQLGRVYREQENYPAAERAFEDMQTLGPQAQKRGEMLLIDTYRASRDIDRALTEAKKAMEQSPDDRDFQVNYAMLLGEKGQTDEAIKVLRSLLRNADGDQEIYLDLAQVEERGRRYSDAENSAKTAEKTAKQASGRRTAWFLLGAIYERQKKYDLAEEQFRKVLQDDPRNAPVLNYYGYMLAERGVRLGEATALIQRAVAEEPNNGAYLDSLGWVYYKQNKLSEAEEYLKKAVDRASHDPTILGHLGDVYASLGLPERAAALWEKALVEWQHVLPADYEPNKVADLDRQLKNIKRRLAEKASGDNKPQ